ncbi:MAG: GNAT family N-acetyltransferase [Nitrososphaeria archaeon]|jgi:lipid II:glycine glycyltransferase (peptidoglycan interpeptide bridge formation enzyme)
MLEFDSNIGLFKKKNVFFAESPFDVGGYDEIMFHACPNRSVAKGFYSRVLTTSVIDLNQSIGLIWKKMDKGSCRWSIKSAIKKGVKVKISQDYDTFLEINHSFRTEKGLPDYNVTPEFMRKYGILFTAEYDGKILGGQFYLRDKKHMYWLIGASKYLESDRRTAMLIGHGNRLMVWEAIRYAKESGNQEFDLGGCFIIHDKRNPLYELSFFKKTFGGKLVIRYFYKRYYSKVLMGYEYAYPKIKKKLPLMFKILLPVIRKRIYKASVVDYI